MTDKQFRKFVKEAYEKGYKAGRSDAKFEFLTCKSADFDDRKFKANIVDGDEQ